MHKAIVTGASSGLGYQIAKHLLENGVEVINLSRSKSDLPVTNVKVDLSKHTSIMRCITQIQKKHKDIDLLVCCAGVLHWGYIGNISTDTIDSDFSINVTSTIKLTNAFLPMLLKQKGDIVIIGSTCSIPTHIKMSVYNSTKSAIRGYIQSLQLELKHEDVRVIGIHPGGFQSKLHIKAKSPLKQKDLMDPKDISSLLMSILAMPRNAQVTEIFIDRKNVKKSNKIKRKKKK